MEKQKTISLIMDQIWTRSSGFRLPISKETSKEDFKQESAPGFGKTIEDGTTQGF